MRRRAHRNWGADELVKRLASRHSGTAWAFLEQVRDSTGAGAARSIDAMALSLWPSRGLALHGFECKISRNDWQRELKQPEKADELQRFCNHWWVVVSNGEIVKDGELPENWGLLVAEGRGLKCVKEAPKLVAQPPDIHLLCSILRRATQTWVTQAECARQREEAREQGERHAKESMQAPEGDYEAAYRKLLAKVERFEKRSGMDLDGYRWEKYADAIKLLTSRHVFHSTRDHLKQELKTLSDLREEMEHQIEALAKLEEITGDNALVLPEPKKPAVPLHL